MDFSVPIGRKSLALDHKASLFDFSFGKSKSKTPQAAASKARTSRGMSGNEGATRSRALREESPPGKRKRKVQTGSGSKKTKPNTSRGRSIRHRDASQESLPSSSIETTKRSGPESRKSRQRDGSQESLPSSSIETTKRAGPESRNSGQRDGSQESLPSSSIETTKRSGPESRNSRQRDGNQESLPSSASLAGTLSPQRSTPRRLPSSPTKKTTQDAAGTSSNTTRNPTLSESTTPRSSRSRTKSADSAISQQTSSPNPPNVGVVDEADNIDESAEVVVFVIDQDEQAYLTLQNSDVTNNRILAPLGCTEVAAGFIQPEFNRENSEEEEDGITKMHPVELNSNTGIGYVKIQGRTIHPPQLNEDVTLSYWVISGNVTVRSVGGAFNVTGREEHYLYPKKLSQGACIVIPKNCLYTLENWDSCDAILAYCYSRDDETTTR